MKSNLGIIFSELFLASSVTYLILLLLELLKPGSVTNFFDLNKLLIVVLISAVAKVLPISEKTNLSQWEIIDIVLLKLTAHIKKHSFLVNDLYDILILSLVSGLAIYIKLRELGDIAVVLTLLAVLLIILLSYLVFFYQENI